MVNESINFIWWADSFLTNFIICTFLFNTQVNAAAIHTGPIFRALRICCTFFTLICLVSALPIFATCTFHQDTPVETFAIRTGLPVEWAWGLGACWLNNFKALTFFALETWFAVDQYAPIDTFVLVAYLPTFTLRIFTALRHTSIIWADLFWLTNLRSFCAWLTKILNDSFIFTCVALFGEINSISFCCYSAISWLGFNKIVPCWTSFLIRARLRAFFWLSWCRWTHCNRFNRPWSTLTLFAWACTSHCGASVLTNIL